jgi:hypothetical protein
MTNEAVVSSIEQLQNSLNDKFEDTIQIVSASADIRQKLQTPLKLDPKKTYKVGVKYFATYNNIGNITNDNNELRYQLGSNTSWQILQLVPGGYEIKDFNDAIQQKVPDEKIQLLPHKPTGRVVLQLKAGVKVDFTHAKTFNYMLGYNKKVYTASYNLAEKRARINIDRSLINIKSDLINSGMLTTENNMIETRNILFSIPTFTVPSNYRIIETPARPEYLRITSSTINQISLQIVDENDKLYDFKGEKIVIKLHIKQV